MRHSCVGNRPAYTHTHTYRHEHVIKYWGSKREVGRTRHGGGHLNSRSKSEFKNAIRGARFYFAAQTVRCFYDFSTGFSGVGASDSTTGYGTYACTPRRVVIYPSTDVYRSLVTPPVLLVHNARACDVVRQLRCCAHAADSGHTLDAALKTSDHTVLRNIASAATRRT